MSISVTAKRRQTNPDQYFADQLISLRRPAPFTDGMANCAQTKAKVRSVAVEPEGHDVPGEV